MTITTRFRAIAATACAAFLFAAAPAGAAGDDGEAAAAVPMSAAVGEVAVEAMLPAGDASAQFAELFAGWEAGDRQSDTALVESHAPAAPFGTVSTPSLIPVTTARMSSGYGMRTHPVLGRRKGHKGVDLAAPTGTPIYATADGTVSRANRFSSYGKYVSIEHGGEMQTRYAHMSRIAVAQGDRVRKGDVIGYVGSTGRSTGPHLHYEVRIAGKAVDPAPFMHETIDQTRLALRPGHGGTGGSD